MKKILRWAGIALIALVFIGTFVFLYQKSTPKVTTYEINTAELLDIEKTTIITGKIEPRDGTVCIMIPFMEISRLRILCSSTIC